MDDKTELSVEELQLKTIEEMKEKMDSMVDPEEFKKLKTSYDKLLNDYINKRPTPKQDVKEKPKSAKELASLLLQTNNQNQLSNRDYVKASLEYREAMIREHNIDPFMDKDSKPEEVKEVVTALSSIVEESKDDLDFRHLYDKTFKDDPMLLAKIRDNRRN